MVVPAGNLSTLSGPSIAVVTSCLISFFKN
jgi:hypothetical protein